MESPSYQRFLEEFILDHSMEKALDYQQKKPLDYQLTGCLTSQDYQQKKPLDYQQNVARSYPKTGAASQLSAKNLIDHPPTDVNYSSLNQRGLRNLSHETLTFDFPSLLEGGEPENENNSLANNLNDDQGPLHDESPYLHYQQQYDQHQQQYDQHQEDLDLQELQHLELEIEANMQRDLSFNPFASSRLQLDESRVEQSLSLDHHNMSLDNHNHGENFQFQYLEPNHEEQDEYTFPSHQITQNQETINHNYTPSSNTPAYFTQTHEPSLDLEADLTKLDHHHEVGPSEMVQSPQFHESPLQDLGLKLKEKSDECLVMRSQIDELQMEIIRLQESRDAVEREREVAILRVKKDLLGEKERLLLDLRLDLHTEVKKVKDQADVEMMDFKNKVSSLESERTLLQNNIKESMDLNRDSIEKIAILTSENEMLKKEQVTLKENQKTQQDENNIVSLQNKVKSLENQVNSLQQELEMKEKQVSASLKPPLPPSPIIPDTQAVAVNVSHDLVNLLLEELSPVLDIPTDSKPTSQLAIESVQLLVSHTLQQSKKIKELQEEVVSTLQQKDQSGGASIVKSVTELESLYPDLINSIRQQVIDKQKQNTRQLVQSLKTEYLKKYDTSLSQIVGAAKSKAKQLEQQVEGLRNSTSSKSMFEHQMTPMKQKYVETLKQMRQQLFETSQVSLRRMETEWKKRALQMDNDWKEKIREMLSVCERRFNCHQCAHEILKRID